LSLRWCAVIVAAQTGGEAGESLLTKADVVPYLLDAGLVENGALTHARLLVSDASRRNRVFVVTGPERLGYVVKQPRSRDDSAVAREAAVLRKLRSLDVARHLGRFLPTVVAYDACEHVLVLDTDPAARDLRAQFDKGRFSIALARASGRALASLHRLPPAAVGTRPGALDPAWHLSWHRPRLRELFALSFAGMELLRLVQGSDELCGALDDLRGSWRADTLIHGDVRWDNWVALPATASGRRTRVILLDWEVAGPGDPCLDIGAFLAEYLSAWINSIPIVDSRDPGRMLRHARRPLDRMQPAIRAFWTAYRRTSNQRAHEMALARAVQFAAARLLQAAVEESAADSELRAHTVAAVQLAVNIVQRPGDAAARLLGLPVPAVML
jgi:aminoglycoside phosphotransferase (APT) family kinase protein